mgnify:FL=1
MKNNSLLLLSFLFFLNCKQSKKVDKEVFSGNPIFDGWYADPEGAVFNEEYVVYPT